MNSRRQHPYFLSRLHLRALPLFVALFVISGCSGKTVMVEIPPIVDLKNWPVIGIIDFAAENHSELAQGATRKFMIHVQGAQPGVRILELGNSQDLLKVVNRKTLDPEAIKAIGGRYDVAAVLVGTLEVSEPKPNIDFSPDLKSLRANASVKGLLSAKLQETMTGATVWTNGAHGQWTVAKMQLGSGGLSNVGISAPGDRYDQMLRELAKVATNDFRSRYERLKVEE